MTTSGARARTSRGTSRLPVPLWALAVSLAACEGAGEGEPPPPPPPPPPSPSTPASIALASGADQQAFSGDTLAAPIVVRVTDAGGGPVQGATVRFSVTAGGGSASPATQPTDASGLASARWRIGRDSGPQTLAASVATHRLEVSAVWAGVPACERTPEVGQALARTVGVAGCADVSASSLAGIEALDMVGPFAQANPATRPALASLRNGDFDGLAGLVHLDLTGNRLASLPAGAFAGAPELQILDLGSNLLGKLDAGWFSGLSKLEHLGMGSNGLSELPAGAFAQVPALVSVDLGLNSLRSLSPEALRGAASLRALLVTLNQIADLHPSTFEGAPGLTRLDLSRNRLKALPAGVLRSLGNLRELYLTNNEIAEFPSGLFRGLSELERIDLSGNRLPSLPDDAFAGLARLRALFLGGNLLVALPPGVFEGVGALEQLSLSPNPGSPFVLVAELARTDNQNALAPGPAQVSAKIAQGAPFAVTVPLAVRGGSAGASSLRIPAGALASPSVEVANSPGSSLSVSARTPVVHAQECSDGAACADGIATAAGATLVLANPPSATATVPAVHLTQGAQSLSGGVSLVAGRRALLRVFVRSDSANAFRPFARATFFLDGARVHAASLEAPPAGIPTSVHEGALDRSFNAVIPGAVLRPGVEMVVEIDPDNAMPLTSRSARRVPAAGRTALDVREVAPLDVTIVPVQYAWDPNRGANAAVLNFARGLGAPNAAGMKFVRSLLPASRVNATVRAPYVTWADTTRVGGPRLLDEIELLRHLEAAGTGRYYHGVFAGPRIVRTGAFWDFIGVAFKPGLSGITQSHDYDGSPYFATAEVIAHELGHNLDLGHAPCGVSDGLDPDFPNADGSTGVWGYDFGEAGGPGFLLDPGKTRDVMSYCLPTWVGNYNFSKALRYRTAASAAASRVRRERTLIVWGGVRDGMPVLEPAFAWNAAARVPERPGPYRVTGWDARGREMFSLAFAQAETSDGGRSFLFAIPFGADWSGVPERMALSGPEGFAATGVAASRRMAVFTDRASGAIRSIARDWPDSRATPAAVAAFSRWELRRGAPDPR